MRIYYLIIVLEGIALVGVSVFSRAFPSMILVLAAFAFVALTFLTAIAGGLLGILRWKRATRWWFLPCLCCVVLLFSPLITAPVGIAVADWQFKRNLSEYASSVQEVKESATVPIGELAIVKIRDLPPHVRSVRAGRCKDGGLVVEFLTASDVPLLHSGYVFKGYPRDSDCEGSEVSPEKHGLTYAMFPAVGTIFPTRPLFRHEGRRPLLSPISNLLIRGVKRCQMS